MNQIPDFQEFLNTVGTFQMSESTQQHIKEITDNPPSSLAETITAASGIVTLEILQRYHQWLQGLNNE